MYKLSVLIVILFLAANSNLVSKDSGDSSMTQTSMNSQEIENCKKAETKLDSVYQLIVEVYSDDKLFIEKLEKSQKVWEKSLEADLEMKYPHAKDPGCYGSVFPMCACAYRNSQISKRIMFLEQWLAGTPEGDVCAGSVKRAEEIEAVLKEIGSEQKK